MATLLTEQQQYAMKQLQEAIDALHAAVENATAHGVGEFNINFALLNGGLELK